MAKLLTNVFGGSSGSGGSSLDPAARIETDDEKTKKLEAELVAKKNEEQKKQEEKWAKQQAGITFLFTAVKRILDGADGVLADTGNGKTKTVKLVDSPPLDSDDDELKQKILERMKLMAYVYGMSDEKYIPLLYQMFNTIENLELVFNNNGTEVEIEEIVKKYNGNVSILDFVFGTQLSTVSKANRIISSSSTTTNMDASAMMKRLSVIHVQEINEMKEKIQEQERTINALKLQLRPPTVVESQPVSTKQEKK